MAHVYMCIRYLMGFACYSNLKQFPSQHSSVFSRWDMRTAGSRQGCTIVFCWCTYVYIYMTVECYFSSSDYYFKYEYNCY